MTMSRVYSWSPSWSIQKAITEWCRGMNLRVLYSLLLVLLLLLPTSTKPQACCFPGVLCDGGIMRLPISYVSSMAMPCRVPGVHGKWVENVNTTCHFGMYLSSLFCAVLLAVAPGLVAVLPTWDSDSANQESSGWMCRVGHIKASAYWARNHQVSSIYVGNCHIPGRRFSSGPRQDSGPIWRFLSFRIRLTSCLTAGILLSLLLLFLLLLFMSSFWVRRICDARLCCDSVDACTSYWRVCV